MENKKNKNVIKEKAKIVNNKIANKNVTSGNKNSLDIQTIDITTRATKTEDENFVFDKKICEIDSVIKDTYKLVVTIVKKGYAYEVIKTATENGGSGAFILNGRTSTKERKRFFGFDITPENELVLMVVSENLVYPIIKSIYAVTDFTSQAKGMVFALPISTIID